MKPYQTFEYRGFKLELYIVPIKGIDYVIYLDGIKTILNLDNEFKPMFKNRMCVNTEMLLPLISYFTNNDNYIDFDCNTLYLWNNSNDEICWSIRGMVEDYLYHKDDLENSNEILKYIS